MSQYEQNATLLNDSYELAAQLRSVAGLYPEFKEIIDYTEVGPRLLTLHFDGVPHSDIYRDSLPMLYTDIESALCFAQMDDFGNMCWADGQAYMWDGYLPPHLVDYGTRDLKNGEPFPYIHDMPACH